jgi:antitoxin MazE
MDLSVISIGNSKGIRLPKTVLEKYNIKDAVEVILEKDCITCDNKSFSRICRTSE